MFVIYCIYGESHSSLLIESTNYDITHVVLYTYLFFIHKYDNSEIFFSPLLQVHLLCPVVC